MCYKFSVVKCFVHCPPLGGAKDGEGEALVRRRDEAQNHRRFLRRLKELFCSLDSGGADPAERRGGIPPGFGWTETEAEYQRNQAAWLRGKGRSAKRNSHDPFGKSASGSGKENQQEGDE